MSRTGRLILVALGLLLSRVVHGDDAKYESVVEGQARHAGERHTVTGDELQTSPGTAGDPFRIVPLLPGVQTPLPLLPVYVIRGASPGMNGFFLDGMRVPQLFHLLIGGSVVHPRLVERIDFYPGAYDASLGHYAGGVIDAETRPARGDRSHGEAELRLLDLSLLTELKLPRGVRLTIAGRYGYPGPIIHLVDSRIDVNYADYLVRLDWRGLTVEALGSYDNLKLLGFSDLRQSDLGSELRQSFHRLQVRERRRVGRVDLEGALVGGVDEASGIAGTGVRKFSLGLRGNLRARVPHLRLQAGLDGELSRFSAQAFIDPSKPSPRLVPDEYGDFTGDRDGAIAGLFAQGTLDLFSGRLQATLGLRGDVYYANRITLVGIDPRLLVDIHPVRWLTIRGGVGLYQQPPSFPIALPGVDTFALSLGLQRTWQGAVTVETRMPSHLTLSLTGYYQRFFNMTDPIPDLSDFVTCRGAPPPALSGLGAALLRQTSGAGYGMELLLRRHQGRFTGWIAYTLSKSERLYDCGLRPADFDQTHVLNVVVQVRLPRQLLLGIHGYVATGRPITLIDPFDPEHTPRNNARLPDYYQLDVRLDREWLFRRWALSLFVEVLNLTYSEASYGVTYPAPNPLPHFGEPKFFAFRWILPSIGVRARF